MVSLRWIRVVLALVGLLFERVIWGISCVKEQWEQHQASKVVYIVHVHSMTVLVSAVRSTLAGMCAKLDTTKSKIV